MPKRKRLVEESPSPLMNFLTRPWFVLAIIGVCFGILTPKIFLPLFRQLFGLVKPMTTSTMTEEFDPSDRDRIRFRPHPMPQAAVDTDSLRSSQRATPSYGHQGGTGGGGGGSKSMLTFLLPVYAVGIGLYMVYTLFKVYGKKKDDNEEDDECSDDEESRTKKTRTVRFKENNYSVSSNLSWDPVNGEFKLKQPSSSGSGGRDGYFARSEESEDELDDYARYRDLDPDYVAYLKQLRRSKRHGNESGNMSSAGSGVGASSHRHEPVKEEIPLTPTIGLTSITNTNVLMNDTLEQMKHSLNKINAQLARKKAGDNGGAFQDQELEELQIQLAQTESQMAKILKIVNTTSDSFNHAIKQQQQQRLYDEDDDNYNDEYDDDHDLDDDVDECNSESSLSSECCDNFAGRAGCVTVTAAEVEAMTAAANNQGSRSRTSSQSSISSESLDTRSSSEAEVYDHQSERRADDVDDVVVVNKEEKASKQALDEEGLRKRRLKKKNYRKRAKNNKKNKNNTSKKDD